MINSINTIKKESWRKLSNSTFRDSLDYKNKSYKFLLFVIFIKIGVDYFLVLKRGEDFSWDFSDFPDSAWTKLYQKCRIKEQFKSHTEKVAIFKNISSTKKSRIIQGIQGIQELVSTVRFEVRSFGLQNKKDMGKSREELQGSSTPQTRKIYMLSCIVMLRLVQEHWKCWPVSISLAKWNVRVLATEIW